MSGAVHIAVTKSTPPAELVTMMAPLVRRIADRVAHALPPHVRGDDLFSAGMIGLLEATRKFEPSRAASFVGYAALRIRGAMLDELRRGDILSQEARLKSRHLRALQQRLERELGRIPEAKDVADALGVSEEKYVSELQGLTHYKMVHLDLDTDDAGLVDESMPNPMDASVYAEMRDRLAQAIADLPEKERLVLSLYYEEELTYKDIGKLLDLTAARICQLHGQAVARLKKQLSIDA
jgi:RNA polymerase sigma factor for flagellar operon FliA